MNLIKIVIRMIRVLKAFVLVDMNMGTSYLESILGSKEAKEHSLAHCTTCLACKTCPRHFRATLRARARAIWPKMYTLLL